MCFLTHNDPTKHQWKVYKSSTNERSTNQSCSITKWLSKIDRHLHTHFLQGFPTLHEFHLITPISQALLKFNLQAPGSALLKETHELFTSKAKKSQTGSILPMVSWCPHLWLNSYTQTQTPVNWCPIVVPIRDQGINLPAPVSDRTSVLLGKSFTNLTFSLYRWFVL